MCIRDSYWMADGQVETFSVPFRYVWPSELDLMARLAGMTLARALERLAACAVHRREQEPRLGVAEGAVAACARARGGGGWPGGPPPAW